MWYIRIYGILMCQHIDAWYAHHKDELKQKQEQFFANAA
jgi:hypothetical protein